MYDVSKPLFFSNLQQTIDDYQGLAKEARQAGKLDLAKSCLDKIAHLLALDSERSQSWMNNRMNVVVEHSSDMPRLEGQAFTQLRAQENELDNQRLISSFDELEKKLRNGHGGHYDTKSTQPAKLNHVPPLTPTPAPTPAKALTNG